MKINERDALNISKPQSDRLYEALKSDGSSASAARRSHAPADAIDLRSQAGLVTKTLASGFEDRASRLEQLRALVQSGRYQVDAGALSQAIVSATLHGY